MSCHERGQAWDTVVLRRTAPRDEQERWAVILYANGTELSRVIVRDLEFARVKAAGYVARYGAKLVDKTRREVSGY